VEGSKSGSRSITPTSPTSQSVFGLSKGFSGETTPTPPLPNYHPSPTCSVLGAIVLNPDIFSGDIDRRY
jgi:hypothetical protein